MSKLKHLGRYLCKTRDYAHRLAFTEDCSDFGYLDCWVDSDWAGCNRTRRSTSGTVLAWAGAIIFHSSQTQPGAPSLSSAEAELRAIGRGLQDSLFAHGLLKELGRAVKIRIWTDSSAARAAATRSGAGKLRHVDVQHFFVQHAVKTKQCTINKINGSDNVSDVLTKYVTKDVLSKHVTALGMLCMDGVDIPAEVVIATVREHERMAPIGKVKHEPWKHARYAGAVLALMPCGAGAASADKDDFMEVKNTDSGTNLLLTLFCVIVGLMAILGTFNVARYVYRGMKTLGAHMAEWLSYILGAEARVSEPVRVSRRIEHVAGCGFVPQQLNSHESVDACRPARTEAAGGAPAVADTCQQSMKDICVYCDCGRPMVLRKPRAGLQRWEGESFFGCSGFPAHCKLTKQVAAVAAQLATQSPPARMQRTSTWSGSALPAGEPRHKCRTVAVQSMVTYTALQNSRWPKFLPLAGFEQGVFEQ
jgi:hypothetical protein